MEDKENLKTKWVSKFAIKATRFSHSCEQLEEVNLNSTATPRALIKLQEVPSSEQDRPPLQTLPHQRSHSQFLNTSQLVFEKYNYDDPYQQQKQASILTTAKSSFRDKYVPIKRHPPSREPQSKSSSRNHVKLMIIDSYRKEI